MKISKTILIGLLFLCIAVSLHGQTPQPKYNPDKDVFGLAFNFNPGASPKVAGTFVYGKLLDEARGTYSFSAVDVLPLSVKPFNVSTNISTGLAQKLYCYDKSCLYVTSGVGVQTDGKNTGWVWNGGGVVDTPLKNGYGVLTMLRFNKSSASEGAQYQLIFGVGLRIGKN